MSQSLIATNLQKVLSKDEIKKIKLLSADFFVTKVLNFEPAASAEEAIYVLKELKLIQGIDDSTAKNTSEVNDNFMKLLNFFKYLTELHNKKSGVVWITEHYKKKKFNIIIELNDLTLSPENIANMRDVVLGIVIGNNSSDTVWIGYDIGKKEWVNLKL